jgi:hypothetical protein
LLIESVKPLKVNLPTGEVHLTPGVPVELPIEQAQRLLAKAHGKVRTVPRTKPDWFQAWRELAAMTYGITSDDPRLLSIMNALDECDNAFLRGDGFAFERAAEQVRAAVHR